MTTNLTIGQVMSPCPVAVNPHHTFAEAHGIMRAHRIRHLPVEEAGRVVGVVSQGDLRLIESLEEIDTQRVEVEDAMTADPYQVGREEPLTHVIDQMVARRIGSALVVEQGAVVGIFTCVDALTVLGHVLAGREAHSARLEGDSTSEESSAG
jgi:acetoin utilization protein AcuB